MPDQRPWGGHENITQEFLFNMEIFPNGGWLISPGPGEFHFPPGYAYTHRTPPGETGPGSDQDQNKENVPKEEEDEDDDGDGADGSQCNDGSDFHHKEEDDDDDKPKTEIQTNLPTVPIAA